MEGMESVYLKGKGGRPKKTRWCSRKVTFKEYFSKFSDQLSDVFPSSRSTTKDILHGILPEIELSNESLKSFTRVTDPKNFRNKIGIRKIQEETIHPSSSKESMPSVSKESNQSTSEGILSTSKQQDKAVSRGWVEAVIISSSDEEPNNVPAREIGQGLNKNQNTKFKKMLIKRKPKKNDIKGKDNVMHVQHDATGERTVPDSDKRASTKMKVYERKGNVKKVVVRVENNEVQNQRDASLTASSPTGSSNPEVKTYQKKRNVVRIINEEVKDNATSSKEVSGILSQLHTRVSAGESIPGPTKHSSTVVKTYKKKTSVKNCLKEAINQEVQVNQNASSSSSESVEVVSHLLESLLINLNSDPELSIGIPQTNKKCFDLQSKANVRIACKVDCPSAEESIKNTDIASLDIATSSRVSNNDHKANMPITPENPDIFKVPPQRIARRSIKRKQKENQEVQKQHDSTLTTLSLIRKSSSEDQKKGNLKRVINEEVKDNATSSTEVNEIVPQLLTSVSTGESIPGPTKHSSTVVKTHKKKTNVQNCLKEAINQEVQGNQNASSSSESVEIVPQLLESLLINLNSDPELSIGNPQTNEESFDLQSKANVEIACGVDCRSVEESITNTEHTSLDITTSSAVSNNDHKANMSATPENPNIFKIPPLRSAWCSIKKKKEENQQVKNKHGATLTASSPTEKSSSEAQKKGNVERVIYEEVKDNATSPKEVNEIVSQLLTSVSAGESIPDPTKHSSTVVKTHEKKSNVEHFLKEAINQEVQINQNTSSSESVEIVSQLLESLLINLSSDSELSIGNPQTHKKCFDLQSKANVEVACKVDCPSAEESIKNTDIASLDIATSSRVSNNDHKANMPTTPENPDLFKVPPRRSTRRSIKKKQQEDQEGINKCEVQKSEELQNASKHQQEIQTEGAEGNSEPRYIGDIISEITKRGGRNRRRYKTVRGQIIVDTTKKLGKKDLIPRKNFVVSFRIHKPFHQNMGQKGVRPGKCLQEIDVLNCQTLADLRKKIMCETDFQDTAGNVSSWPYSPVGTLSKNLYKSGMFYINNTFYVDTREGAEDYSVVIRKWAEEHFIQVGETKPMNEMKVEDLEVRFGYPYLYMHQGSCEHLIIISDARLLTEKKSLHSSDYPNLTKTTRSPVYYCVTCTVKPADWIVVGSDQMIQDTNFMCKACFQSLHYRGAERIGNFKAYRWKQRAILFH